MSNFSNSKTAENLMSAFMAENADGAKYQWLADECTKEQQSTLAKQLKMLATNEMAHAKIYQDLIIKHNSNNQVISFSLDYPITQGTILEQIKTQLMLSFINHKKFIKHLQRQHKKKVLMKLPKHFYT